MVEVFKTNITSEEKAEEILLSLKREFPLYKANFDLEDCDNILRCEGPNAIEVNMMQAFFEAMGFWIEPFPNEV